MTLPPTAPPGAAEGPLRRRGAVHNPRSRFERIEVEPDAEYLEAARARSGDPDEPPPRDPRTEILSDPSRSIIATNDSPDVPFDASLNPYRGCEHGCIYCYARPGHEYLGFSAGLDFETKILAKPRAPALLRRALASPRWTPRVLALGGVTDGYQPAEQSLRITRGCLEVLAEFRNPVAIVTKSGLVLRDVDLLSELARFDAVAVYVSITTLSREVQRVLEPRAATPTVRLAAVEALARAGIPVGVMVAPLIPALTDHEVPAILEAAARAGARCARTILLRLPHGLADLFEGWLERHFPGRRQKVMNRVRAMRGGRSNDARFHSRMRGTGTFAEQSQRLFALAARRAGLPQDGPELSAASFRRPAAPQLSLFPAG